MPNIEIHGLGKRIRADVLAKKIFQAFSDKPYIDEMVVTIFPTHVQDKSGKSQPFLRLVDSGRDKKRRKEIVARLNQFELDIELLGLEAFYPKTTTG